MPPPSRPRAYVLPRLEALLAARSEAAAGGGAASAAAFGLQSRLAAKRKLGSLTRRRSPFERMQHCRDVLERLDKRGWNRSFHQRLFHEDFLVSLPAAPVCVHAN